MNSDRKRKNLVDMLKVHDTNISDISDTISRLSDRLVRAKDSRREIKSKLLILEKQLFFSGCDLSIDATEGNLIDIHRHWMQGYKNLTSSVYLISCFLGFEATDSYEQNLFLAGTKLQNKFYKLNRLTTLFLCGDKYWSRVEVEWIKADTLDEAIVLAVYNLYDSYTSNTLSDYPYVDYGNN